VEGRLVWILVDGVLPAGRHSATWSNVDLNGSAVAPGAYFVRMETPKTTQTRKVIVVR
jgi:hypothetical protein